MGPLPASYIAKWNGSSWGSVGDGLDGSVTALVVTGGDVFAGGNFAHAGTVSANRIAKWNGNNWVAFGSGLDHVPTAIAVSGTDVYATGVSTTANAIAKWSGSSWVTLGNVTYSDGSPAYPMTIAISGTDVYVGGIFSKVGGTSAYYIAKWNGSSWMALGGGGVSSTVRSIVVSGNSVYVGGYFAKAGSISVNCLARWDGTNWRTVGGEVSGSLGMGPMLFAIAANGNDIYAGGDFSRAGTLSASGVAKWDGTTWSALGSGVDDVVYAIATSGGNLYAMGRFVTAGGIHVNHIARWDGVSWSALGNATGVPTQLVVGNVRANQGLGTQMCDVYYDLNGGTNTCAISIAVSTNGGASYNLAASHFSGTGYGTSVVLGSDLHVIWDAGADFPSQFSTTMRVCVTATSGAASVSAVSPIFSLNTRNTVTGAVTGRVLGGGLPLPNVQVKIEGTVCATNTAGDGRFMLTGVPTASGYVLGASGDGYMPSRVTNVVVSAGTMNLGDIALGGASRPFHVIPLVPDVNPTNVTVVEDGGTAYRYYQVVAADGKTPVVSTNISVRIVGGSAISQANDVSDVWAGRVAGVPDADGIVRLRIPATALGGFNITRTVQVLESGVVQQAFGAVAVPRVYDQVWKHRVGGGVSGKIAVVRVGGSGAYESEVRQTMEGGVAKEEQITRTRSGEVRVGLEVGAGLKVGAGGEVKLGAGGYVGADLQSAYHFSPNSTSAEENAMKVYVAMGDELSLALGPAKALYDFVGASYERDYLNNNLDSVDGSLRLGGYAEASANFDLFDLGKEATVGVGADLSGECEIIAGTKQSYGTNNEFSSYLGLAARGSASVGAGLSFEQGKQTNGLSLTLFSAQAETEFRGNVVRDTCNGKVTRVETEQTATVEAGMPLLLAGWMNYDTAALQGGYHREFTETLTYPLPDWGGFDRLTSQSPVWNAVGGSGLGSLIQNSVPGVLVNSMCQCAFQNGTTLQYEKSVYASEQKTFGIDLDVDLAVGGFALNLEGGVERGAEVVNERGKILRSKRMALETYPAVSTALFPANSIVDKEYAWLLYASGPVGQALNQAVNTVASAGGTLIQAGQQDWNATLRIGQGGIAAGSQIISSWAAGLTGGGGSQAARFKPLEATPKGLTVLPPPGATNYVYGIGGVYRFASSNAFNGGATLAIHFTDAQAAGLNKADLRIYRLADKTNRWQLVGGTVNTASNTATASITNWGSYALAPPLPTGDLWRAAQHQRPASRRGIAVDDNGGGVAVEHRQQCDADLGVHGVGGRPRDPQHRRGYEHAGGTGCKHERRGDLTASRAGRRHLCSGELEISGGRCLWAGWH